MIDQAIEFVRKETESYLGLSANDISITSARKLAQDTNPAGVFIALVNLEEETALRNLAHVERRDGQLKSIEPPVHLNLYLLFGFDLAAHDTALVHLSKTVELFQHKRWFGPSTQGQGDTPFPASIERLVFEMVDMNFEALNNLWGVLGGTYVPSIVYKVRLVRIQAAKDEDAPEISTIALETAIG